ncbi:MAG: outer membrane protein assembly factor BamD [candidate division Zixibacteria bacterium]|nr:outer membrane protein assembly factor BamD [candidate division Zixibacteria bacterium]MCI0596268.1 outer membrane protein assembly factor BamD [candidate division Zixibacteria bacterium]
MKRIIVILLLAALSGCGGAKSGSDEAVLPAAEQMAKCRELFSKKKWAKASVELSKMVLNYPGHPSVDTAQFMLGLSYFNQDLFVLASEEFKKIGRNFPSSPLACQAEYYTTYSQFKLAPKNAAYDQKDAAAAVEALRGFLEEWTACTWADSARTLLALALDRLAKKDFSIGRLYFKMKDWEAARIYLQGVIDEYGESNYGPEALYLYALSLEKEKKFDLARAKYEAFLSVYPSHKYSNEIREKLKKNSDLAATDSK